MKFIQLLFLFGALIYFLGCSSSPDHLLGAWIDEASEQDLFRIEKFGDNLTIVSDEDKYPLSEREKDFSVNISGQEIPLIVDQKTDKILFNGKTYIRYKNSEKQKLLGRYYEYDRESKSYNDQNSLSIAKRQNNTIFADFSDKKKKDGALHKEESGGVVFYPGGRDYYGNRFTESVSSEEIQGKKCIVFSGATEGDFWEFVYCEK